MDDENLCVWGGWPQDWRSQLIVRTNEKRGMLNNGLERTKVQVREGDM